MGKYDPLRRYLSDESGDRVTMSFEQVAALVPGGQGSPREGR